MAVIVLLLVCGWISIVNAQSNTVTILPQGHQSFCRGESISYNCIGSGITMEVFSPPIVNESNPVAISSIQVVQSCNVLPNSVASIVLVDPAGSSSLMGTFTFYISDEQLEGQRTVYCRVTASDGTMVTTNQTTFSVLVPPNPATTPIFEESLASSKDTTQVAVSVSWDAPENAQEFTLQIQNSDYNNTIRSFENSVTVLLPYGTFSATLCTINRCGKICQYYPNIFSAEPPQMPTESAPTDSSFLIAAIIAGILGFLLILASIYGVAVTVIICNKNNARVIEAEEMK